MNTLKNAVTTTGAKVAVGVASAFALVLGVVGLAGATGTTLEDQFTSTQTSILSELGYGAALLIAILLFVIGITVLVKWARKGSKMTA